MLIKRGCTNYERKCGPSNQYTFDPEQEEIERYFFARFTMDLRLRRSPAARRASKPDGRAALGTSRGVKPSTANHTGNSLLWIENHASPPDRGPGSRIIVIWAAEQDTLPPRHATKRECQSVMALNG